MFIYKHSLEIVMDSKMYGNDNPMFTNARRRRQPKQRTNINEIASRQHNPIKCYDFKKFSSDKPAVKLL